MPFYCPNSPRNQNKKEQKTHTHTKTKKHLRLSTVPKIWCATDTRTEKVAYRGGSPIQKKSTLGWRKKNCKPSSLTQTLIYRLNMYYSKIYKREDWKTNSSTLHLEVRIRYFRHRYSINFLELMDLKIIKAHQCSLERSHVVLIKLKEYFQPRLMLI